MTSKPHSEHLAGSESRAASEETPTPGQSLYPLPTVAECDEQIAGAEYVLEHPDDYDIELRVQAAKDKSRWAFNRRFALRVQDLEEQFEAVRTMNEDRQHRLEVLLADAREQYQAALPIIEAVAAGRVGPAHGVLARDILGGTSNPASGPDA